MNILIINSQGHWINGWMSFPESLNSVVKTLQESNCEIETVEVQSLEELHLVLEEVEQDTLIWANAYLVNSKNGKEHNLIEQVQQYNLPILGSNSETLLKLLEKDTCQQILEKDGIPVPEYFTINKTDIERADDFIRDNKLPFPLIIKPTKESRSNGITKVDNKEEAIIIIEQLGYKYPNSNIIVEEFLPTDDITCGFLRLGDEIMLLPSYNVITGMDCTKEILSAAHYELPPSYKKEVIIQDSNILGQLEKYVPLIVNLLEIHSFTRVDGRLDQNGVLKFFDINGMPGLNYSASAIIKQCIVHFPSYSEEYLFQALINTIVLENLDKYNLPAPPKMRTNHLFNLKSESVIKLKLEEQHLQDSV